jgi:hypothetical protein
VYLPFLGEIFPAKFMVPGGIGQKYNIVTDIRQRRRGKRIRMRQKDAEEMKKQGSHLSNHNAAEGRACQRTDACPSLQQVRTHTVKVKWTRCDDLLPAFPPQQLQGVTLTILLLQSSAKTAQNEICIKFKIDK